MFRATVACAAIGLATLTTTAPVMAHHSVTGQFDVTKIVDTEGVLTRIEWINPHGIFEFDVTAADGKVVHWLLETPPPAAWRRLGVASRGFIPVGVSYKLQFCVSRDGSNKGLLTVMRFPDGREISVLGAQQIDADSK